MIEASDIEILLTHRYKKFDDGNKKELLHGYVTYKGSPVMGITGQRVKDKEATTFTGEAYSFSQYALKFTGTEDRKNTIPREVLFLRGGSGSKFNGTKLSTNFFLTESVVEGEKPSFANGFKSSLFDPLIIPMSGTVSTTTVVNSFGDEVSTLTLKLDEGMYAKDKKKVKYKLVDTKGYFPDEDLPVMKEKQFQFFDKFVEVFQPKTVAPTY